MLLDGPLALDAASDALIDWDLLALGAPRAASAAPAAAVAARLAAGVDGAVAWLGAVREASAHAHVGRGAIEALLARAKALKVRAQPRPLTRVGAGLPRGGRGAQARDRAVSQLRVLEVEHVCGMARAAVASAASATADDVAGGVC